MRLLSIVKVKLNILVLESVQPDLQSLEAAGAEVVTTDSCHIFDSRAAAGIASFIAIPSDWIDHREALISTLETCRTRPTGVIATADLQLAHLLGSMGVPEVITLADFVDLLGNESGMVSLLQRPESTTQIGFGIRNGEKPKTKNMNDEKRVVFGDPKSRALLALVDRVAQVEVTTLLSGPSGVGKEVIARVLHASSARRNHPFLALNCAAIPEQLVESTLFGHIKGSFTGAIRDQKGVFEEASGGVLFLDEVGELPMGIQPKLLRAIQERRVCRVGSFKELDFDVRLITATNRNLSSMVAKGEFREDLLYRLNTFHISIPALRERPADIEELAISFAESALVAGVSMKIDREAISSLLQHNWPGNIRELENVIARAKVLATANTILKEHIFLDAISDHVGTNIRSESVSSPIVNFVADDATLSSHRDQAELDSITDALRQTSTKKEAAERLGISPRTLRHKLQKLKELEEPRGESSINLAGV